MNVTCDKCNKRYSIADDKVRGKSVKIRCKQCQNLISVQGPAPEPAAAVGMAPSGSTATQSAASPWAGEETTRAMPAMDASAQWFAMVKGKQVGPLDLKGLEGKVKTGELTLRTYLWKHGMGDWKRASDVPEVSPVFAGVSVGATATGPTSATGERPSSKKVASVQRDVAVALEIPLPEITRKPNGNGNDHPPVESAVTQPVARHKVPSQARAPVAARPTPATAPTAATQPAPELEDKPLADLFGDHEHTAPSDHGPIGTLDDDPDDDGDEVPSQPSDPFAALGAGDPAQVPAVGEATKFFIAQAGVNKRNPPWKIALFIIGGPGLVLGTLFLLSTLEIVPLQVTHVNEKGEEVQESFFSAGGVSGIKDLFSGEAKKRKEDADKAKQLAAEKRRQAAIANKAPVAVDNTKPEKAPEVKPIDPAKAAELALIYGTNTPGDQVNKGPRVRAEDRPNQKTLDSSGLSQEASQKVIADKIKGFEACVEQALRRTPNLAVGPIDVVLNVGASGAVTSANIVPAKHNNSDWGVCMRDVAKRIVFPKSDGETEVSLPLKVGVAMSP